MAPRARCFRHLDQAWATGALVGLSLTLLPVAAVAGPFMFPPGLVGRIHPTPRLDTAENRVADLEMGQAVADSQAASLTARVQELEHQHLDSRVAVAESTLTSLQAVEHTQYGLMAGLLANLSATLFAMRRRSSKDRP